MAFKNVVWWKLNKSISQDFWYSGMLRAFDAHKVLSICRNFFNPATQRNIAENHNSQHQR